MKRPRPSRVPECGHPDLAHAGHGLCHRCYNARYHSTKRKGLAKQRGSVYPQAIVKVPVRGWGYLG